MVTAHKNGTERIDFNQKREKKGPFAGKNNNKRGREFGALNFQANGSAACLRDTDQVF